MCKVSVLVPVYNVEKYLKQCMDSLLQQTLSDIEIICIDDGSTDRSGELLDAYAAQDHRVRVVRAIQNQHTDICICNCDLPDQGYQSVSRYKFHMKDEVISGYQALKYMNLPKSWPWVTAWNKLYRTELFVNLRYPEGMQHEDQFLAHYIFARAKRIVSISDILYFLRYREDSLTNSRYDVRRLDYMDALYDRIQFYQTQGFQKLYRGVEWKALKLLLQAYQKLEELNSQEVDRLQQAEEIYQKIYCISSGRKQLNLWRKGVCTFVKSVSHCSGI